MATLQIPDQDQGTAPSRPPHRPTSVAVTASSATQQQSRRQRASHNVVSSSQQQSDPAASSDGTVAYPDVFSHPAAVAYAAAHPRRQIPRFGPYLLLRTLGEGEFGKVKLGLHVQYCEEVAVKLIRRGNIDTSVRMSKVEREIEVLRTLKHPHIVRLYDVIETDKYIGIILEYASGGELFDHILAHRYLREKDAAKLFSQLISGVWYIHQKKIVHRDLKLENLLLDRNRNVIITDFGFANRFEHRSDDLMQTSCGSPCYAAPELVISEGLYVGSAVDIWSCGVILYAMLAGYLPFDDDPANPDGDNINLLYKYIVSTPLSFPDYISQDARDLLSTMLVPDPSRRTTLDAVMRHPWLSAYHATRTDGKPNAFGKTVEELEKAAIDQHHARRVAYQRQLRANAQATAASNAPAQAPASTGRSQSHRPEVHHHQTTSAAPPSASAPPARSRSTQPEYLYDSASPDHQPHHRAQASGTAAPPVTSHVTATPTNGTARKPQSFGSPAALGLSEDDPFAGPPSVPKENNKDGSSSLSPNTATPAAGSSTAKGHKANSSSGGGSAAGGFRHTIQVEYDDPSSKKKSEDKRRDRTGSQGQHSAQPPPAVPVAPASTTNPKDRRASYGNTTKPLPPNPIASPANGSSARTPTAASTPSTPKGPTTASTPTVNVYSPPATPSASENKETTRTVDSGSQNSAASSRSVPGRSATIGGGSSSHKKGKSSLDKLGLAKIFGNALGGNSSNTNTAGGDEATKEPKSASATSVLMSSNDAAVKSSKENGTTPNNTSPTSKEDGTTSPANTTSTPAPGKKSRRNTLTVMVEPFSRSIRGARKGRAGSSTPITADGPTIANGGKPPATATGIPTPIADARATQLAPHTAGLPVTHSSSDTPGVPDSAVFPATANEFVPDSANGGMSASTSKARKVMQWFRTKSKGRDSFVLGGGGISPVTPGPGLDDDGGTPIRGSTVPHTAGATMGGSGGKYQRGYGYSASSSTVNQPSPVQVVVTTPGSAVSRPAPSPLFTPSATGHPQRSASTATESGFHTPSFVTRFRNSVTVGHSHSTSSSHAAAAAQQHPYGQLRIHHGAVDQTTITTRPPPEVMAHVRKVLDGMGVEIQMESEFKYRCVRVKKRKGSIMGGSTAPAAVVAAAAAASASASSSGSVVAANGTTNGTGEAPGLAAVSMVGSAASNGVDRRGLPLPSPSAFASSTGGMLKGLLMRRQSSQVSAHGGSPGNNTLAFDDETSVVVAEPSSMPAKETAYGDPTQDAGDEVRFSVELTRLDRLNDTYSLDIRRLKGNLRSYKFLYDTLRHRADLSAIQA